MREYHNGNEVDTSQLRWIGSSPPSLTKDSKRVNTFFLPPFFPPLQGAVTSVAAFCYLRIGKKNLKKWEKTLDKSFNLWYNIYRK